MTKISTQEHFIIGDVHGCFHTLEAILKHWKPGKQQLIFVGDLIDHGKYSPETVELVCNLKDEEPETIYIRGNHEQLFQLHVNHDYNEDWFEKSGEKTFSQYLYYGRKIEPDAELFRKTPLFYETPYLMVSHAGICDTKTPFDEHNRDGVLYHRNEIKKLKQLQVYGHTPQNNINYDAGTHSICIDTGAYKCNKLTALIVDNKGNIKDVVEESTHPEDMPNCEENVA